MSLGVPEILIIVGVLVLLFGGAAAVNLARQAGGALGTVKRVSDEVKSEVDSVFRLDDPPPRRPRRAAPDDDDDYDEDDGSDDQT